MNGESEIRNIEDLEAKLADVTLLFEEIKASGDEGMDGKNS